MKKFITLLLLGVAFATQAQTVKQLKRYMFGIASDATKVRFTGSLGYRKAANYSSNQLKAAGIKVIFQAVPFTCDN